MSQCSWPPFRMFLIANNVPSCSSLPNQRGTTMVSTVCKKTNLIHHILEGFRMAELAIMLLLLRPFEVCQVFQRSLHGCHAPMKEGHGADGRSQANAQRSPGAGVKRSRVMSRLAADLSISGSFHDRGSDHVPNNGIQRSFEALYQVNVGSFVCHSSCFLVLHKPGGWLLSMQSLIRQAGHPNDGAGYDAKHTQGNHWALGSVV